MSHTHACAQTLLALACRAVHDYSTLCAALCTSKGAAETIHSAVGGLAPVKLHLRFHDITIQHLKPPADWLARHGRALVGT